MSKLKTKPVKELVIIGLTVLVVVLLSYQSSDYFNRSIMDMLMGRTLSHDEAVQAVLADLGSDWEENSSYQTAEGKVPDIVKGAILSSKKEFLECRLTV